ncbi:DNA-(apurinic or apyrimidinic site) endonuclease 2-like [Artemia franciscana]|uniref:DNA-(apurinic or apyrimidinic site) endonuclease 2-like n=1 Tax=Artemia franciscana TaxID=6661 RepID=UPI0032DBD439
MFSVVTWNINGIRSNKNYNTELRKPYDIVCFQETKITRDMLTESIALVDDFSSYFAFSRKRTGYSGVATYCRSSCTPVRAEEGLTSIFGANLNQKVEDYADLVDFTDEEIKDLESEGRCFITEHEVQLPEGVPKNVVIFNLYIPRADPEKPERLTFKLKFLELLNLRAKKLLKSGKFVILAGDFNISHQRIDHCEGANNLEFEDNPSRKWLSEILKEKNDQPYFVDLFRKFNPGRERAYTCWNTSINARSNNYGTRIDYIVCDSEFAKFCTHCDIRPEVMGSDHCPVEAKFDGRPTPAKNLPSSCSKFYKEFSGKQQKLIGFFSKMEKTFTQVHKSEKVKESPRGVKRRFSGQQTMLSFVKKENLTLKKSIEEEDENYKKEECIVSAVIEEKGTTKEEIESTVSPSSSQETITAWKKVLKGPPKPPKCKGHTESCLLRTVKKKGANYGRQFWVCPRGEGHAGDPQARCDFFQWIK